MTKVDVKYSKKKYEMNNMEVVSYKFSGEDVKKINDNHQLNEEMQSLALDKMLDANPNYLELNEEEQNGLIISTMTLETVVYWLLTSDQVDEGATMYNASHDSGDIYTIEFFYMKENVNSDLIKEAFSKKKKKEKSNVYSIDQGRK